MNIFHSMDRCVLSDQLEVLPVPGSYVAGLRSPRAGYLCKELTFRDGIFDDLHGDALVERYFQTVQEGFEFLLEDVRSECLLNILPCLLAEIIW